MGPERGLERYLANVSRVSSRVSCKGFFEGSLQGYPLRIFWGFASRVLGFGPRR